MVFTACSGIDSFGSDESEPSDPSAEVSDAMNADCGDDWPAEAAEFEQQVFERVNDVRASGTSCGGTTMPAVGALRLNVVLTCTARAHSQDMAERDFFDHENPDGDDPFDRMRAAGYDFNAAGENIAWGQSDPEEVMQTWLDSPGHCTNIMGEDFEDLGVGYFLGPDGPLWTQNFGRAQ